ncbi:MAG: IS110 family transposase [Candidatus Dormibacteraeota bacterium]|uniref:IS110 family transposase n=1 Tax=Candidatus Nephthysia bennettiae TaxID=3127016 RepID=A0A934K6Z2_9BACT|nr:IS110 family transposase [Candidatus Dormibacteraeota bacterium]
MVFVGIDWAEAHHDVCLLDEAGRVLAKRRLPDGLEGVRQLHVLLAERADEPEQVIVGIETDHGLLVGAMVAAGYQIYAINPLAASRYRERHVTSRAKSDAGDAKVLADLVRTDRHNHRPVAGDSELAEAIKVLARAHRNLIWTRQRQVNQLRSALREFYPGALEAFGADLASADAIAILERVPTPGHGRSISETKIASALRKAGRERNLEEKAAEIQAHLRAPQLFRPNRSVAAPAISVTSIRGPRRSQVSHVPTGGRGLGWPAPARAANRRLTCPLDRKGSTDSPAISSEGGWRGNQRNARGRLGAALADASRPGSG